MELQQSHNSKNFGVSSSIDLNSAELKEATDRIAVIERHEITEMFRRTIDGGDPHSYATTAIDLVSDSNTTLAEVVTERAANPLEQGQRHYLSTNAKFTSEPCPPNRPTPGP
ncbi:hypothetical protein L211DRAFT_850639 [Terfezia boudieri ATCC MYA-4762]|uniref:Uncharacterized protein n=1 Tax=Terfezia boudieri ATCC MYA-4762 TaxID=1051890 RepID=A0A3N4LHH4_9PEZI|nr:hypothetical protein L211DRAFT_850639 [Terfezia boudieri ATCC MYA-4762]